MKTELNRNKYFDSPVTSFDQKRGMIEISGRAIQLDSNQFWKSMNERLLAFMQNTMSIVSIRFQMEYIHSSNVQQLLEFLKLSKILTNKQKLLEVEWLYKNGDEDMLELGNVIHEIVKLPMKYIKMN